MTIGAFIWWTLGAFGAAYIVARILIVAFKDERPPIDLISGPPAPPSAVEQTCPECGRTIQPTDEVHFDGRTYRHSWCSFHRAA